MKQLESLVGSFSADVFPFTVIIVIGDFQAKAGDSEDQ